MTHPTPQCKILMTMALPYANGEIHMGHLVEAIQADIWARQHRLRGHDILFISGSDAHGTPVMLSAKKAGVEPAQMAEQVRKDHLRDLNQFLVEFDNFYTTHSPENKILSHQIYQRLFANGDISTEEVLQAFDAKENIFLADRFIRGECPRCSAKNQYGDNCEVCGETYTPLELKNPISSLSGTTPEQKASLHYFFELNHYRQMLHDYIHAGHCQPQIANKLDEWFTEELKKWDISRDAPYFGFEIPNVPNKYLYVWLDAPVGYMASLKNLADKNKSIDFDSYWSADSKTELYHFVGKDIVYFHALFWPAMLKGANYRLPTQIFVHGFLTVNGQKMSKSRGTYISAKRYLEHLPPEYLRYYFAAKLNAQVEDIDLNFSDLMTRVNADLVGKYINLASRCAGFITKKFEGKLASQLPDATLYEEFLNIADSIAQNYEALQYSKVVRDVMALADRANQYIDHHKPWALAKESGNEASVQAICTQGLNLFRVLSIYLQPILPKTASNVAEFLNVGPFAWSDLQTPLLNHTIKPFKPLMQRITPELIADFEIKSPHEQA